MPTTKSGEKISWKEFMKRWKKGIEGITPYQQVKMTIRSTWIVVIGLVAGIVVSCFNLKNLWWLMIILVGGLFNTLIIQLGNYQKHKILKTMYDPIPIVETEKEEVSQCKSN